MRQKQSEKPWQALGMSRATWYRRGKPTKPRMPKQTYQDIAQLTGVSVRTVQRMHRVLSADPVLCIAVEHGAGKWGQAERLILNPEAHRRWREANGLPWPPEVDDDDLDE